MPTVCQHISMCDFQDEVSDLVTQGSVGRQQRIYELSRHFSDRDWLNIERLLEENEYLLRDFVIDLVSKEAWTND